MNLTQTCPIRDSARCTDAPIVFVVDNDDAERERLAQQIRAEGWSVQTARSAEEFLVDLPILATGCLIVEQHLPGMSGLDLQLEVGERLSMPVILMSRHGDIPTTVKAMKAGAHEFLQKPFASDVLLTAIDSAITQSEATLLAQSRRRNLCERYDALSRREREVMHLVTRGRLNKLVGVELGISEITVKAHRGRVMRKMQATTFVELVNMATKLRACHEAFAADASLLTRAREKSQPRSRTMPDVLTI